MRNKKRNTSVSNRRTIEVYEWDQNAQTQQKMKTNMLESTVEAVPIQNPKSHGKNCRCKYKRGNHKQDWTSPPFEEVIHCPQPTTARGASARVTSMGRTAGGCAGKQCPLPSPPKPAPPPRPCSPRTATWTVGQPSRKRPRQGHSEAPGQRRHVAVVRPASPPARAPARDQPGARTTPTGRNAWAATGGGYAADTSSMTDDLAERLSPGSS